MDIYSVSKVFQNGNLTKTRYIYAPNRGVAINMYRNMLGEYESAISCEKVETQGMILAHRDTPTTVRSNIKIFNY